MNTKATTTFLVVMEALADLHGNDDNPTILAAQDLVRAMISTVCAVRDRTVPEDAAVKALNAAANEIVHTLEPG